MSNRLTRNFLCALIAALGLVTTACHSQDGTASDTGNDSSTISTANQEGIVNGTQVTSRDKIGQSIVAIVAEQDQGEALCTGSILTNDMVLTAAHCVEGSPSAVELVFATKIQGADDDVRRPVVNWVQNPKWKPDNQNGIGDLAILQFSGGLPEGFQPMTFAPPEFSLSIGMDTLLMGYGVTDGESHAGPGILRETTTQILSLKGSTLVVTDGSTSSVCFGDSGGPALAQMGKGYVQWGVASSVASQDCQSESIHTSVLSYEDWMNRTMDSLRGGSDPQ